MFLMVDIALFFNQYVNPIALDALDWKYYIFYCVWLAVELAVVYFFYVETRNTPRKFLSPSPSRHIILTAIFSGGNCQTFRRRLRLGRWCRRLAQGIDLGC